MAPVAVASASERRTTMDPLIFLGLLAVIIGIVGVIVLIKGKKKNVR
jgi:hypothetical protein